MKILDVGISAHDLLSDTHSDTTPGAVTRGGLIVGQGASPTWSQLTVGGANAVLGTDGTDVVWVSATGSGNVVRASSPTIVTPTIASFANAGHSHLNAAGGGTLTAAAVSDLGSATVTFTNKSGAVSQWTNDSGYVTPSSVATFTNKAGNISQWTNNVGYLTSAVTSATGTANQVTVSAATGAVTFSLPQDIATGSSPTFGGLSIGGSAAITPTDGTGFLALANQSPAPAAPVAGQRLYGSTSGLSWIGVNGFTRTLNAGTLTANRTWTLPDATGQFVLRDTTDTLTNKSGNISQWTNDTGYLTAVTAHNLLSATHGDTLAASVVRGSLIVGNATPKWAALAIGSANAVLSSDGTDATWVASTGTGNNVRATSPTLTTPTIAKLANLTSNGFVKTSGGDGTLSVDTATYLTTAVTSATGTANQVTVSASTGAVTWSLPQSIHTGASPTFTGLSLSAALTDTQSIAATSTDGIVLTNTTAAAAGAQQWSPRIRLTGQGWKTTATAASQTVDWIIENQPVQGTANPTSVLAFSSQVNAGGYVGLLTVGSGTGTITNISAGNNPALLNTTGATGTAVLQFNGTTVAGFTASQFKTLSFGLSSAVTSGTDVILERDAANTLAQRNSTTAQTFRVYNTFTDASNYERGYFDWSLTANEFKIGTAAAGTGTARTMRLMYNDASTAAITIAATSGSVTIGNNSGNASTVSKTLVQIGSSAANMTATSGTNNTISIATNFNPSSTSTMVSRGAFINPTINYSAGTPGAGSYEALTIQAIETALPTGTNYLIRASAGSAGTTDIFRVTNTGNLTLGLNSGATSWGVYFITASTATLARANATDVPVIQWVTNGSGDLAVIGNLSVGATFATRDLFVGRAAAADLQLGVDVNGAAVSQTLRSANGITGTDKTGGNFTLASGKGTGAGAVSSLIFQTPTVLGSGTTAQSLATRLTIDSSGLTIADAMNVVLNATTGTKFGTATSQKMGFYNATPVVQRADMSALVDSTTGTPGLTLNDVGVVFSQAAINNNFASVLAQINKVRTAFRDLGFMA